MISNLRCWNRALSDDEVLFYFQQHQRLEAIKAVVARMRKDLEKIGGFENRFISVPAGGVQHYIEELEKALNGNG